MAEGAAQPAQKRFVLPPGYTQIPNELLDEVLCDGSLAEVRVTLMIARRTFGFGHGERLFSNAELCELCRLSRQSVTDGLKAGEERGTIRKRNMGGNRWAYGIPVKNPDSQTPDQLPKDQDVDSLETRKSSIQGKQNPPGGNKDTGADAPAGAGKAGKKKPGQEFNVDSTQPIDAVIVELFERWRDSTSQPANALLTNKRAGMIKARLREQARGVEGSSELILATARTAMLEAVDGWAGSSWHREREAFDFSTGFCSYDKVEMFRGRFREQVGSNGKAPASAEFAAYDQAVENQNGP